MVLDLGPQHLVVNLELVIYYLDLILFSSESPAFSMSPLRKFTDMFPLLATMPTSLELEYNVAPNSSFDSCYHNANSRFALW